MNRAHSQLILAGVLSVFATLAAAEEIVVIVNPANATSALKADQVAQIYLAKTTSLPAGGNASPLDLADGSPVRDDFYMKVTGKSAAQIKALRARLVFSGKDTPPKVLDTAAQVKKYVAANPNAIGYIEKSAVDASVKVVLSIP